LVALKGRRVVMAVEQTAVTGGVGAHLGASIGALEAAGNEVVVLSGREGPSLGSAGTCVIPGLDRPRHRQEAPAEVQRSLLDALEEAAPDVIHLQQLPDPELIPLARHRAPVVGNVHNFVACTSSWKYFRRPGDECGRQHGPGCWPHLLFHGCAHGRDKRGLPTKYANATRQVRGLRAADATVAHSRFVADHLALNGIEEAVVAPLFPYPPPTPSAAPKDGPVVFSGRVTKAKGVETFLRAVAALDMEAEVCGDGWFLPRAKRLAEQLGIADRVTFHGWMAPDELSRAYERAQIVVVPSHWPEPFGLVGIEALARARPVVATATGGIPEWLTDGETGLLVEPGDAGALAQALDSLRADPGRRARMGERGVAHVAQHFTAERYVEAIARAYSIAERNWRADSRKL
jgi:glycosyltransferase involved in cell wall biosynthesis